MIPAAFISQWQRWSARHWLIRQWQSNAPRDMDTQPLLDEKEILDLRLRVAQFRSSADYHHELEHRTFGDARSVYRGYGMDYDESRPYLAGDELRFMNWRLTARTGQPFMKVFREERKPGVFIVVDRRQAMRFGTRRRLKVTQAVRAAATIAFAAHRQNAPVSGVLLESGESASLSWLPEHSTEAGLYLFINAANKPCPPANLAQKMPLHDDSHGKEGKTTKEESLSHVIRLLTPMLAQGSRVVLISDFSDLDESSSSNLLELSMTHHLQAIQVIDPAEEMLPACGNLLLQADEHSIHNINSSNKKTMDEYQAAAAAYINSKQALFQSLGIPQLALRSDEDAIEQLIET